MQADPFEIATTSLSPTIAASESTPGTEKFNVGQSSIAVAVQCDPERQQCGKRFSLDGFTPLDPLFVLHQSKRGGEPKPGDQCNRQRAGEQSTLLALRGGGISFPNACAPLT